MMVRIIRKTIDVHKKQSISSEALDQSEKEDTLKLKALQAAAKLGLDDIKAGRFKEFDSKASLRKHLKSVLSKVTTVK
jgi:hypothetical protein